MIKIHITKDMAYSGLRQAIELRGPEYVDPNSLQGENVDNTCEYWLFGEGPGCIVGLALYRLGVPAEDLDRMSGGIDEIGPITRDERCSTFEFNFILDQAAEDVFRCAQDVQDSAMTWGEALQHAREVNG